ISLIAHARIGTSKKFAAKARITPRLWRMGSRTSRAGTRIPTVIMLLTANSGTAMERSVTRISIYKAGLCKWVCSSKERLKLELRFQKNELRDTVRLG